MPPKIEFITPIYHPNICMSGGSKGSAGARICLNILEPSLGLWSSYMTIHKTLLNIVSMLSDPNPNDALSIDIGKEMLRDKKKFENKARLWTFQYAK